MKYIVEITAPEYMEVDASSEEQAIEKVTNSIQDLRLRAYARFQVCKEISLKESEK